MKAVMPWIPLAVLLSGAVAGVVIWLLSRFHAPRPGQRPLTDCGTANSFLLRDGFVIDHDADAAFADALGLTGWANLRQWLGPRFPDLPQDLAELEPRESRTYRAGTPGDTALVTISAVRRGRHRVTLDDPDVPPPVERHEAAQRMAQDRMFRKAFDAAPCAICILGPGAKMQWCNSRFDAFSQNDAARIVAASESSASAPENPMGLADPVTGQERYFDITLAPAGAFRVLYASEVTRLVEADAMRASFIQTLTKTFADLAAGLVVFDSRKQLVLFNPAMIDLTGLPAEFLSARPGVMEFFDQLRDKQVLPEPKNYATWRSQINDMIESAAGGHYSEDWTLPGGPTYRVTGRPHPDGAIAFLFEDISNEVTLSRRSRTQLEIRQAVLDRVADAIAVTGPNGMLVFCNQPFREILGFDPDRSFAETGFGDLVTLCRDRFPDTPFWNDVAEGAGRTLTEAELTAGPDGPVHGRVVPLSGGFAMLQLSPAHSESRVSV